MSGFGSRSFPDSKDISGVGRQDDRADLMSSEAVADGGPRRMNPVVEYRLLYGDEKMVGQY